ncbi:hypothetical protein JW859_05545 [bacterium]|nr:hypothetical protein [bacterium]
MRCGLIAALIAALLIGACAAGAIDTNAEPTKPEGLAAALPSLASLAGSHQASEAQSVNVTDPYQTEGTEVAGGSLLFTSPADGCAWAIFEIDPAIGIPVDAVAETTGPLWLLAGDYSEEWWEWTEVPGETSSRVQYYVDTSWDGKSPSAVQVTEPFSGSGTLFLAVVCPPGASASLDALAVNITMQSVLLQQVNTSLADRNIVNWMFYTEFDYYEIYRSTVPDDPEPYLIHTEDGEEGVSFGEYFFNDLIPEDDGDWLPDEQDNGTELDTTDDFPSVAPGVDYYYYVLPYYGPGLPAAASNVVKANHPWGDRRTARRELPDTTSEILVFADQLLPNNMTAAQVQWCAENLVGTQKIFDWQADEFRQYNDDFIVVGYHLGNGAGPIGNVHGDDWDGDADWPYVDLHEDWFIHPAGSSQPDGRCLQQDWNWYVAAPDSPWQDYLAANLLQLLGEDHLDGWFVDSCHQPWNTDPAIWWPSGMEWYEYFTPKLHEMLRTVNLAADAHPLQPYVIPNAGQYVTTVSDIKYYGDDWACDGIMIEGHARWGYDGTPNYFALSDWILQQNRILDHQTHGLATILQSHIYTLDTADRLFVFGTYLLVKGDHTYINWLGDDGTDWIRSDVGQWYPEFDIDDDPFPWGAPSGATPATMADLYVAAYTDNGVTCGPFYRRNYPNGFVIVNPGSAAVNYRVPWTMQSLSVNGGGNVLADGTTTGSYSWNMRSMGETVVLEPHTALIVLDVYDAS